MADDIQNSSGNTFNLSREKVVPSSRGEGVFAAQDKSVAAEEAAASSEEDPKVIADIRLLNVQEERRKRVADRLENANIEADKRFAGDDDSVTKAKVGAHEVRNALPAAQKKYGQAEAHARTFSAHIAERNRKKRLGQNLQSGIGRLQAADRAIKQQYSEAKLALKKETADAQLEAETRFTDINNQINELRAKDPGQPIFSSSWGIAAALVGSIRQGMFGGDNTAMSMLNKMVEQAAKQQMASIKNLQEQSTSAGKLVNGIIKGASSDQKLLSDLYKANLKDVDDSMKDLIKQYEIKLKQDEDLTLTTAVQKSVDQLVKSDTAARIAGGKSMIGLAQVVSSSEKLKHDIRMERSSTGGALAPTKHEVKMAVNAGKDIKTAFTALKAYSGVVYSLKDVFAEHIRKGELDTSVWERFKVQGIHYLPKFLKSKAASKLTTLNAKINAAIYAEIHKTQAKISDADRIGYEGWENDGGDDPVALSERTQELIDITIGDIKNIMIRAADSQIFPSTAAIKEVLYALPDAGSYAVDPWMSITMSHIRDYAKALYGAAMSGNTGGIDYIKEPSIFDKSVDPERATVPEKNFLDQVGEFFKNRITINSNKEKTDASAGE